jgi:uncharacterized DUF497 family protein
MELRFYHDPDTEQPHIYNHGVTEREAADVLRRPMEDAKTRRSRVAIGQTSSGRYLKVVYVPDEEGDGIFVITAYDLGAKEMHAFRRRMRRRRQ